MVKKGKKQVYIVLFLVLVLGLCSCSRGSGEEVQPPESSPRTSAPSEIAGMSEHDLDNGVFETEGYVSSITGSKAKNTMSLYITDSPDMVLQCMGEYTESENISDTENMRLARGKCIRIKILNAGETEVFPGDRIRVEIKPDMSAGKGCFKAERFDVVEQFSISALEPVTNGNRQTYTVQGAALHARELFENSEIFNLTGWLSPVNDDSGYYYVPMSYILPSYEDAMLLADDDHVRALSGEKTRTNENFAVMVPEATIKNLNLEPGTEVTLTGKLNIYDPEGAGTYIFLAVPDLDDERYFREVDLNEIKKICREANAPCTGEYSFRISGYVSSTELSYNGSELENVYLYITDSPDKVLGVQCIIGENDPEIEQEKERFAEGDCARARLSNLSALKEWIYSASRIKPGSLVEFSGDLYDNTGAIRFGVESEVRVVSAPQNTVDPYSVENGKKVYTVQGAIDNADALAESGEIVYIRGYVSSVIYGLLNEPSGYLVDDRDDTFGVYYFGPEEDTDFNPEHRWTAYSRALETDSAEQNRAVKGRSIMIPAQMLIDAEISPKEQVTLAGRIEKRKDSNTVKFYCYSASNESMLSMPCSVNDIINVKHEIILNYGIVRGYISSVDMVDEKTARIFIVDSKDDIFDPSGAPGYGSQETSDLRMDKVLCLYTDLTDCGKNIDELGVLEPGDLITADGVINYDVVGFSDEGSGEYTAVYGYSLKVWEIKEISGK